MAKIAASVSSQDPARNASPSSCGSFRAEKTHTIQAGPRGRRSSTFIAGRPSEPGLGQSVSQSASLNAASPQQTCHQGVCWPGHVRRGDGTRLPAAAERNRWGSRTRLPPRCQAQSDATTQPRPSRRAEINRRSATAATLPRAIRPSAVLVRKSAHREIGCDRGARGSARPADQNHQTPAGLRQCQGLANLKITRCAERRRIAG